MVISHLLLYYVMYVLLFNGGSMFLPSSFAELRGAFDTMLVAAWPTWRAAGLYLAIVVCQVLFAFVMPGLRLQGRPNEQGVVMDYLCNA